MSQLVTQITHRKGQPMTAKKKTRVVLSIDEDIWHEFQKNLKSKGYPRGTASWIVQRQFERLNTEIEITGDFNSLT